MNLKKFLYGLLSATLVVSSVTPVFTAETVTTTSSQTQISSEEVTISLSDTSILVNGESASTDNNDAVYTSHDIIYYEDKDTYDSGNAYGEGTAEDKHSSEEALKHTVVNITKPGTYRISGQLSYGQIFVNVGKDEADKVILILDHVDINCSVAPAVFFYQVYECDADATVETATNQVDTSNAGARVIIADDSVNHVTGSYVARIYKDTTEQKKLHKYDGAFYSRMSMEIDGETKGNGVLNITSDNEGLDTELHLTINGGKINIQSSDDGINVNEDGISVFTMNDGYLNIYAGNGSEGDGIDSNGWNVINGGTVISLANPKSMDGGIDSDMGSTINGGTVIGAGNMYDPLEDDSKQLFMFLQLAEKTDQLLVVTDEKDNPVFAYDFPNDYTYISLSTPTLTEGTYHVYKGGTIKGTETDGFYTTITSYFEGTKLHHGGTSTNQNIGMMTPPQDGNGPSFSTNGTPPEIPDNTQMPNQGQSQPTPPEGIGNGERPTPPEGITNGEPPTLPEGMANGEPPAPPEGMANGGGFGGPQGMQSSSETENYDFVLSASNKGFTNVSSTTATGNTASTTPSSTTTNTVGTTSFSDVKGDSWYAQAVTFCKNKGLMGGTSSTTFSPSAPVTREMFATILYRLAGSPNVTTPTSFTDVKNESAYYYKSVSWANQSGITKGISSNAFGVGQSITVQDAVVMLERYGKGGDLTQVENVSSTSTSPATRAQIAALLMQYCNN